MAAWALAWAASTPAATRPELKIGSVNEGPTANRPCGPNVWPLIMMQPTPAAPVRNTRGKKSDFATPMRAVAAASYSSA